MSIKKDDPRLTAFALGELEGPDRAEIEKFIAENREAEEWIQEIQKAAGIIEDRFGKEKVFSMGEARLKKLESRFKADVKKQTPGVSWIPKWRLPLYGVASMGIAAFCLILVLPIFRDKVVNQESEMDGTAVVGRELMANKNEAPPARKSRNRPQIADAKDAIAKETKVARKAKVSKKRGTRLKTVAKSKKKGSTKKSLARKKAANYGALAKKQNSAITALLHKKVSNDELEGLDSSADKFAESAGSAATPVAGGKMSEKKGLLLDVDAPAAPMADSDSAKPVAVAQATSVDEAELRGQEESVQVADAEHLAPALTPVQALSAKDGVGGFGSIKAWLMESSISSTGGIDPKALGPNLEKLSSRVRTCYSKLAATNTSLTKTGRITFTAQVDPSGAVIKASVLTTNFNDPALADCIVAEIKKWRLPPPAAEQTGTANFGWEIIAN